MNINLFFSLVFIGLFMILFLFQPIKQKNNKYDEIPVLELQSFKLTKLDTEGLSSILEGELGFKYKNRYILEKLNYTDSTNNQISNIKADKGVYKGDKLSLEENIAYFRDNKISFQTQLAKYNTKTKIIQSPGKYTAYHDKSSATGSSLVYNSKSEKMKSENITINYKLKERK